MKQRIGLVCPYSFTSHGGVQNHVLGLASWLQSKNFQPYILGPGIINKQTLKSYDLKEWQFQSAGKAIPFKANGSVARINFSPNVSKLVRYWLVKTKIDLLHIHEPLNPTVSLLALTKAQVPVAATFHAASPVNRFITKANQIFPRYASRIDAAIAVSASATQLAFAHHSIHSEIIGNGLKLSDYPLTRTKQRWRAGNFPRIAFVGRYDEPRKGFNLFAKALPAIQNAFPDLQVIVIGDGKPRNIANVTFIGAVDDQTRNNLLASSDVYIAPQTGRESFGIVLLEALACGTPVVASDLSAFQDVLRDGNEIVGNSFINKNHSSLAQAVIKSLNEPRDLRLEQGRRLAANYDWSKIGMKIVKQYEIAETNFHQRPAKKTIS